mmetsp:Transcript_20706/g.42077  ORF Transcript_20706/g.42077 Transcript_20706/m.42077 type:complete len:125 (+) Transcript_20706:289-663(+)
MLYCSHKIFLVGTSPQVSLPNNHCFVRLCCAGGYWRCQNCGYYSSNCPRQTDIGCCLFMCSQFQSAHQKFSSEDACSAAGIFGCNSGRDTHAAATSSHYVDINGWKVLGNGSVIAPGKGKHAFE